MSGGIKRKLKKCRECEEMKFIFSKGRCKYCAQKEYAVTARQNQKAKRKKPIKKRVVTDRMKKAMSNNSDKVAKVIQQALKKGKGSLDVGLRLILDPLFQELCRLISAIEADRNGWVQCISCDNDVYWRGRRDNKKCDGGHFYKKELSKATRWYLPNCNAQCIRCNRDLAGNEYEYGRRLDQKYYAGYADRIREKAKKDPPPNTIEMINYVIYYRHRKRQLMKLKNFE